MSEARVHLYQRLMEAEDRIARGAYASGLSEEVVQEALDAADERLTTEERREDLYLASLTHFVEALGGRLEVRVLIGERAILVRRDPA